MLKWTEGNARSLLLAAVAWPLPVLAQTAGQITPSTFAPPQAQPQGPVSIPQDSGASAPPGADRLAVTLADVRVDGLAISPEPLAKLRGALTGKRIRVSEIFAAARALETDFARAGHVLTRVVVPAQPLADGATLKFVVVAGVIEQVDTTRLPANIRRKVETYLAPLVGRTDVTEGQLERRLLLASDVPGVILRSTLSAGGRPGAVNLSVDADYRPVSGFASIDNALGQPLGRYALAIGFDLNSVLGSGEAIYLRASGLPNTGRETSVLDPTPRNRALAAGIVLPLGADGLTFNLEGTDARTAPRHADALPGFGSRFQRLSGRLRYPVVRSRALTVALNALLDAQDERVRIISPAVLPISLDRLRIIRAGGDLSAYLPGGGVGAIRLQGSFGINALGARSARDATAELPLSRAGADASFQKADIFAALDQPVAANLALALRARAQTSFGQAMANSEQIGLASADAISPLPSGSIQGDSGAVARAEVRAPFAIPAAGGGALIAPYVFAAYGSVRFSQPSALERRTTNVDAFGAGLRVSGRVGAMGLSAGVEYGRAHISGISHRPDRVSFSVTGQF